MSFKKRDGDTVIVRTGGVYKECDLYEMDGALFAAASGGFVRLNKDGSTSKPTTSFTLIKMEGTMFVDKFGRLCTSKAPDRTPAIANADGTIKLLTA